MGEKASFIGFSSSNFNKLFKKEFKFIWLPVALLKLPKCQPGKVFIVDCCLHAVVNSSLLRLMLIKSVKENKIVLQPKPPIKAPMLIRLRCSLEDFIKDMGKLKESIGSPTLFPSPGDSWVSHVEPWRIFLSHVLSPTEKIIGPLEKIPIALSKSIMRSLIEDMLAHLCTDNLNIVGSAEWNLAYLMLALKEKVRKVMLLIGNELVISETYAKNIFENENVYKLIIKTLQLN